VITEQGETVSARYGDPELAARSLEQTLSAVLLATAREQPPVPPAWRAEMERMSERARERYRALVYDNPSFARFFEQATPIAELTSLNIGSRPSKRASGGIEALRAIPWVFAWTQARVNLTGWYGVGAGLEAVGDVTALQDAYANWPLFQVMIDNVEMSLAKTDARIARRYLEIGDRPDLTSRVLEEHERTTKLVLQTTGHERLLENRRVLGRAVSLPVFGSFSLTANSHSCSGTGIRAAYDFSRTVSEAPDLSSVADS
jgi:phosphoenolpyruvate carboxylase